VQSVKALILGVLISGVSVLPLSAGLVTWTFGGSGNSGASVDWYFGSDPTQNVINTLSGTFVYDADVPSFSNPASVTITGNGTLCTTTICPSNEYVIPTGQTWFVLESQSSASAIELVNVDPTLAANSDLTDVGGTSGTGNNRAFAIQLSINGIMTDAGGTLPLPVDQGDAGYCSDIACASVITTAATGNPASLFMTDPLANISAQAFVPNTSGTPEPATFVLAGSVLLGLGLVRRKLAA
jgi:hypothetical protein